MFYFIYNTTSLPERAVVYTAYLRHIYKTASVVVQSPLFDFDPSQTAHHNSTATGARKSTN